MALGKDFLTALGMEAIPLAGEFGRSYLEHSSRDRDRELEEGYARRLAQNALGFGILGAQGTYGSALNALGQGGRQATDLYRGTLDELTQRGLQRRQLEGTERMRRARTGIMREELEQKRRETLRDALKEKREREARERLYGRLGAGDKGGLAQAAFEAGQDELGRSLVKEELGIGKKSRLSADVRDQLEAMGVNPLDATTDQKREALRRAEDARARVAGMRGAQKIQIEREIYNEDPLPASLQGLLGVETWGQARRSGYNIPSDPKVRFEKATEWGGEVSSAERFAEESSRLETTVRENPTAYGLTGDISATISGIRAQLKNINEIYDPKDQISEADILNESTMGTLENMSGVGSVNRRLRAKLVELAFDAARAEQGGGHRIPVSMFERKLEALTGNTQDPETFADTVRDRRLEALNESRARLEGQLQQDLGPEYFYRNSGDIVYGYKQKYLKKDDLRNLAGRVDPSDVQRAFYVNDLADDDLRDFVDAGVVTPQQVADWIGAKGAQGEQ